MTSSSDPLSWTALMRVTIMLIGIYLTWKLSVVIAVALLALMFASALYPLVQVVNKKLPLTLASIIVLSLLVLPLAFVLATLLPAMFDQFPALIATISRILAGIKFLPDAVRNIDFNQYTQNIGKSILDTTSMVTSFLTIILSVIFLSFYILIDFKRLKAIFIDNISDEVQRKKLERLLLELSRINGYYIRGNLLISLICGLTIWIALTLLQIPYALPLSVFAGLVDLLPLVGATLATIPAILIAFSISPLTGIIVLLVFATYQTIENNVLSPLVYRKNLELSPALSLLSVIVGTKLFGIMGAFIALPFAASFPLIIKYMREEVESLA